MLWALNHISYLFYLLTEYRCLKRHTTTNIWQADLRGTSITAWPLCLAICGGIFTFTHYGLRWETSTAITTNNDRSPGNTSPSSRYSSRQISLGTNEVFLNFSQHSNVYFFVKYCIIWPSCPSILEDKCLFGVAVQPGLTLTFIKLFSFVTRVHS